MVELGHGRGDHDVSRREAAESEGAQAAGAEAARRCQRRRSRDGRACLSQPRIRGASIRQRARARAPRVRAWWLANYYGRVSLQSAMCPSRRIWYACSKISTKEKSQDGQSQRCADRIDRSGHVGGLTRTTSFSAATHLDVARDFCNVAQRKRTGRDDADDEPGSRLLLEIEILVLGLPQRKVRSGELRFSPLR